MEKSTLLAIRNHIARLWPDHKIAEEQWTGGPVSVVMPDLRVLAVIPKVTGQPCMYVTCGASDIDVGATYGLEFLLCSRAFEPQHVELVSMVAYMHRDSQHHFDVGHTMKIGHPWEKDSLCDRLLVSLPHPAGPQFEILHLPDGEHVRFLWLVPITAREERFRHQMGQEALESRFEQEAIDFLDPARPSVV
jgi:hypothetical protein